MTGVQTVSALERHLRVFRARSVTTTRAVWNQDSAWSTIVEHENVSTTETSGPDILAR